VTLLCKHVLISQLVTSVVSVTDLLDPEWASLCNSHHRDVRYNLGNPATASPTRPVIRHQAPDRHPRPREGVYKQQRLACVQSSLTN
jgi:hypothetical protein